MWNLWSKLDESISDAREHMQTHEDSPWLERLDGAVSDIVGMVLAWSRVVLVVAWLMWSFFMVVLPLLLATATIVGIAALAAPRGTP